MNEGSKNVIVNTIKEWTKFTGDREKFTGVANDIAAIARKSVQEGLSFMKTQNVDVECETPENLKVLGVQIHVDPVIDATFPTIKASVVLKCGSATRTIVINPNMTISAGGPPVSYEQLKKAVPPTFETNAAEFVRDAFLFVARTGGKE
ncbi:MAG TPA: hypothetical protein DCP63_02630 [Bacteroidetes bacterium]|nr:hypothetical protein [Bacteroidota bacterium]